jgi:phosphonoacetate hydrolase
MFTVNDRSYAVPSKPIAIVCIDGFDPTYLDHGIKSGILPNLQRFVAEGFSATADSVLPTFTVPNNISIITGVPPSVHGVSGNYYLDRKTGQEIMVTDASLLRCETILAALSQNGARVAAITAKDKLRKILGHNLKGISFSSEKADQTTLEENGIEGVEELVGRPRPDMYDSDLSLFVLDAGIRLLEEGRADVLYLSLSDLVQHSAAPGEPSSNDFHVAVDQRLGRLVELGAMVGVIADHGMSDKSDGPGAPRVIYLQTELEKRFGDGAARVICPITDPFVKHHGALGSFVRVYLNEGTDADEVTDFIERLPGVALAVDAQVGARRYELPADREGDLIVLGDASTAIGSRREEHDLSGIEGHRFRTHGGLSEQPVPFLTSHPLERGYRDRLTSRQIRNFDIFDALLNGCVADI